MENVRLLIPVTGWHCVAATRVVNVGSEECRIPETKLNLEPTRHDKIIDEGKHNKYINVNRISTN